jgi:hypothetical protein
MEGRNRPKRKRLPQFRRMTKRSVNRSESEKFGAVFYHPAQNVTLGLAQVKRDRNLP